MSFLHDPVQQFRDTLLADELRSTAATYATNTNQQRLTVGGEEVIGQIVGLRI